MNTPTARAAAAATAIRKARIPPRNDAGALYCEHPECHGFELTFRRMCEWHKHMDRHERPYKCFAYGCELTPGFTYSGGLLRHQREVHKMNMSAKQPLFCPFPSCNRNRDSENGFTRRENLEEHKRRRHMSELLEEVAPKESPKSSYSPGPPTATAAVTPMRRRREEEVLPSPSSSTSSSSAAAGAGATAVAAVSSSLARLHRTSAPALKRRRADTSTTTTTTTTDDPQRVQHLLYQSGLNEHQLIHLLQCRLREREDMIRAQAAELCRYQSLFHSLPHQAVYGVGGEQPTQAPQQLPGGADSTAFARVADTKEPRV
ncbi:hypothetical protein LTS17_008652 [Exophiala oligosperma]